MSDAAIGICVLLAGLAAGWIAGHDTVAADCKRLGAFYVGSTVFECHPKEKEGGK